MSNVRNYCLSGRIFETSSGMTIGLEEFFKFARMKKCVSVELRHTQINPWSSEHEIRTIVKLSGKYSLPVEMMTMRKGKLYSEEDLKLFRKYLKLATALKCRQIKVSGDPLLLKRAAVEAEQEQVILGTNNHIGAPLETQRGTLEFLDSVNHPNFRLHFDPSHLWVNRDPATKSFIMKILDKISYIIIQDYIEADESPVTNGGSNKINNNTTRLTERSETQSLWDPPSFQKLPKRTVRGTTENEVGEVGYPEIMSIIDNLDLTAPYGLVQPGALYYLNH